MGCRRNEEEFRPEGRPEESAGNRPSLGKAFHLASRSATSPDSAPQASAFLTSGTVPICRLHQDPLVTLLSRVLSAGSATRFRFAASLRSALPGIQIVSQPASSAEADLWFPPIRI